MEKLNKKLLGLAGLLLVIAATMFASTLPPSSAYASSDITVSIEVKGQDFSEAITSPVDGADVVSSSGTVRVIYNNATAISVIVSGPEGNQTIPFDGIIGSQSGSVDITYTLDQGYGDYVLTPEGVDINSNHQSGNPITIHYHSANSVVTNPGNENESTSDPIMRVNYGPEVCRISFQFYIVDPMGSPQYDPSKPLLDPAYTVDVPASASPTDITIPISEDPYNLPGGLYKILMNTYDCSADHNPIESNLDINGGYESGFYFYNPGGDIEPPVIPEVPDTGIVNIAGIMIAERDLIATGIIVLTSATVAYLFVRLRHKTRR